MNDDRWPLVKELFEAAVELPLSERSDFLLSKIAGDDLLRQEVAALLAADRGGAALARYWPVASESLLAGLRTESQPTSDSGAQVSPGLISGSRVGGYDVIAPLGAGGMGEVYRAHDARLGRDVAIKILPELFARDANRLSRFSQEARAVAALNHPNILGIYDVGSQDGTPYLICEFLKGDTLREKLESGALP